MSHHSSSVLEGNETSVWGKDQNWAVIWFVAVIFLGTCFVVALSNIDSWMYHNDGRVEVAGVKLFDDEKFQANRQASFSIPTEGTDRRIRSGLTHAYKSLNEENK